jgi:GGDEF domain-containing protein
VSDDAKRTSLWGKLTRGLFEFDAPLTERLLPLLPDPTPRARRGARRPPAQAPVDETLEVALEDAAEAPRERAALVVVHGHAPGERFDLEPGEVTLGPDDDAVLRVDDDGVTLLARGAAVHVEFRRVREARLEHGALVGIGGTLLRYLRCVDLEAAHFDERYRLHRFDGLTDVHHERYLRHRLWGAMSHARRHRAPLALAVVDLAPRTARGAVTGEAHDLVLRAVAQAARRAAGEDEVLGRHGRGQLALVLPGLDLAAATARAGALRAALAAPVAVDGQRVAPEPALGLAALAREMVTHDELLRAAVAALPARAG